MWIQLSSLTLLSKSLLVRLRCWDLVTVGATFLRDVSLQDGN